LLRKTPSISVGAHWSAYVSSWAALAGLSFSELAHRAVTEYIKNHPIQSELQRSLDLSIEPPEEFKR
jgi:hypothetical protein